MRQLILVLIGATGCAPPAPVQFPVDTAVEGLSGNGPIPRGDPAVRIVHPVNDQVIALQDDCSFKTVVAWDVDFFNLVEPGAEDNPIQGHVHVQYQEPGYDFSADGSIEIELATLGVGGRLPITVTLQSNSHVDLDQFEDWMHVVEIEAAQPSSGVVCP